MYDSDLYTSDEDEPVVLDKPVSSDEPVAMDEPAAVMVQYGLDIGGIKLQMPVKPYPCQEMVIQALIDGCNTRQNCLIESPTGSGKTLALLCGSLGWLTDYTKKLELELEKREYEAAKNGSTEKCEKKDGKLDEDDLLAFDEEDWADDAFLHYEPASSMAVPKVFYCSRTHKQLDQVVSELRRTSYGRTFKMTVLSSREFTCIQETDMNKTKLCGDLLDPSKKKGCCYYTENNKDILGTFVGLKSCGMDSPWDIEDLIRVGKTEKACPYFAARNLMSDADLILCPYNYILDQGIREGMQINVSGSVIILDEAHNIEDVCRESGSVSISVSQLEIIISNCNGLLKLAGSGRNSYEFYYVEKIQHYCENLSKFIVNTELKKENLDAFSLSRWTGPEFVKALQKNPSLTPQATVVFMNAVRDANAAKFTGKETLRMNEIPTPTLDGDNLRHVEKIAWALKMVMSERYANDYRMFVKQSSYSGNGEISLEFLCMNAAVIFAPLCELARSVILASGTLAPMSSYQGELGVKFPYVIQADHVTPRDQVFIKCVETNTVGNPLKATYQTVNTSEFQDDIGRIVLTACNSVPHGILVFLSSYNVMEKLCTRWQKNDMWNKFSSMKEIFQETRRSGDITAIMESYRETIRRTSEKRLGTITGALLFAVYRGKIAEGIDFSDNEARCVLTIGIPYAVRQHPAIDLKCRYNDQNRSKGLLSGSEWYTVNAFKGLNQALGRAIRHQNDWAAIIMVDARIMEPRHSSLLPKWMKSMWFSTKEREVDLRALLNRFVARQIRRTASKEQREPILRKCDML